MPKVDAIYKDGKFEPVEAVNLADGQRVSVDYHTEEPSKVAGGQAMKQIDAIRGMFTAEEAAEFNTAVEKAFEDEDDAPW